MSGAVKATAFAPASVGNVAVGFDILGHALEGVGDVVTVSRRDDSGVEIMRIVDDHGDLDLPWDPERNTATCGLFQFLQDTGLEGGLTVEIEKGIPIGSGMGGSAASAVAAAVAANALLEQPLPRSALLAYALKGEAVAHQALHADNVAPSLFGGLVLAPSTHLPEVIPLPVPPDLSCVLVHPHIEIKTRSARSILAESVDRSTVVTQCGNLAVFVASCINSDLDGIRRSLRDVMIEPQRRGLIPGFEDSQRAALAAGALGCSISGSGPSMFAWCESPLADEVRNAMIARFAESGIDNSSWISAVDAVGAHIRT